MNEADMRYRKQRIAEINEDIKKLMDERTRLQFFNDVELLNQCRALIRVGKIVDAVKLYRNKMETTLVDAATAIRAL